MQIRKVAVIGCGLMGCGIAQVCATAGLDVSVLEIEQQFLDRGFAGIEKSLAKLAEKGKLKDSPEKILARLRGTTTAGRPDPYRRDLPASLPRVSRPLRLGRGCEPAQCHTPQPGRHPRRRPPITCRWRCGTLLPESGPTFMTRRVLRSASPSDEATRRATANISTSKGPCSEVRPAASTMCCRGTTSTCVGATGRESRKA